MPVTDSARIASILKQRMAELGYTNTDVSRLTGRLGPVELGREHVSKLVNNRCAPKVSTLIALARALKIGLEVFDEALPYPSGGTRSDAEDEFAGQPASALRKTAIALDDRGEHESALRHLQAAWDRVNRSTELAAKILISLGIVELHLSAYHLAIHYLDRALSHPKLTDQLAAYALWTQGIAERYLGRTRKSVALCGEAVRIANELGDGHLIIVAQHNLGKSLMALRRPTDIDAAARLFADNVERINERRSRGMPLMSLELTTSAEAAARAWVRSGQEGRGLEYHEQSIATATKMGDDLGRLQSLIALAETHEEIGETHEAVRRFEQCSRECHELGIHHLDFLCQYHLMNHADDKQKSRISRRLNVLKKRIRGSYGNARPELEAFSRREGDRA